MAGHPCKYFGATRIWFAKRSKDSMICYGSNLKTMDTFIYTMTDKDSVCITTWQVYLLLRCILVGIPEGSVRLLDLLLLIYSSSRRSPRVVRLRTRILLITCWFILGLVFVYLVVALLRRHVVYDLHFINMHSFISPLYGPFLGPIDVHLFNRLTVCAVIIQESHDW